MRRLPSRRATPARWQRVPPLVAVSAAVGVFAGLWVAVHGHPKAGLALVVVVAAAAVALVVPAPSGRTPAVEAGIATAFRRRGASWWQPVAMRSSTGPWDGLTIREGDSGRAVIEDNASKTVGQLGRVRPGAGALWASPASLDASATGFANDLNAVRSADGTIAVRWTSRPYQPTDTTTANSVTGSSATTELWERLRGHKVAGGRVVDEAISVWLVPTAAGPIEDLLENTDPEPVDVGHVALWCRDAENVYATGPAESTMVAWQPVWPHRVHAIEDGTGVLIGGAIHQVHEAVSWPSAPDPVWWQTTCADLARAVGTTAAVTLCWWLIQPAKDNDFAATISEQARLDNRLGRKARLGERPDGRDQARSVELEDRQALLAGGHHLTSLALFVTVAAKDDTAATAASAALVRAATNKQLDLRPANRQHHLMWPRAHGLQPPLHP